MNALNSSGYSSRPLYEKLGLKKGCRIRLINPPDNYRRLIGPVLDSVEWGNASSTGLNFIHFFTNSIRELEDFIPELKQQLDINGTIWVSWYKKSAGKKTELSENLIRDSILAAGLVDIKVCSIDADWSALKFVFRLKDR
jgi:Protein of unknown function (DUF3052)